MLGDSFGADGEFADRIDDVELPPPLDDVADEYDDRIGGRDRFLWKWLWKGLSRFTLSCVPDERARTATVHKTLLSVYITLVDDLGEKYGDWQSFEAARNVPFGVTTLDPEREELRTDYLRLVERVWEEIDALVADAPRGDEFRRPLEHDVSLATGAVRHGAVVNDTPEMLNPTEAMDYSAHNMMLLSFADADFMHSPDFDETEYGAVRETIYRAQKLTRLTHWASTWEREVEEGDCSAGIFARAIDEGVLDVADVVRLESGEADADRLAERVRAAGLEDELLDEWEDRYDRLEREVPETESVDLEAFVAEVETVRFMHMASRGRK